MCLIAALIAAVAGGFTALSMFTFVAEGSANAADVILPQGTYCPV